MRNRIVFLALAAVLLSAYTVLGGVALNQNFEGFTTGSLNIAGQGSLSNVGGLWSSTVNGGDPSVVVQATTANSSNKALRFTDGTGNGTALGSSNVAPIAYGTPFILKFSVFFRNEDVNGVGSVNIYCDNAADLPAAVGYAPIWIQTDAEGTLYIYNGYNGSQKRIYDVNFGQCRNQWVDFKAVVTTWDDGTGQSLGSMDTYVNFGSGWQMVDQGTSVDTMYGLHGGVNAVYIAPYHPLGSIQNSYDNIVITSTPLDCHDKLVLGGTFDPQDINKDCVVNIKDFAIFASEWMFSSN
jgi:hypothetical protein